MIKCRLFFRKIFIMFLLLSSVNANIEIKSYFGLSDLLSSVKKGTIDKIYENRFWIGVSVALVGLKATRDLFFKFRIIGKKDIAAQLLIVGAAWFVTNVITRMSNAEVDWYVSKRPELPKQLKRDFVNKEGEVTDAEGEQKDRETEEDNAQKSEKKTTCPICSDDKRESQMHKMSCCGFCCCKKCLKSFAYTQLRDGNLAGLKCSNPGCPNKNQQMAGNDLKAFLDEPVFKYVKDLKNFEERQSKFGDGKGVNSFVSSEDYGHCPTPNCDAFFMRKRDKDGKLICGEVECPECKNRYCNRCLKKHSRFVSCDGAKSDDELKTEEEKKKITKKCPKCRNDIFKDGGCKHMHCKKCNYHFCWDCLGANNGPNGGYPHNSFYECTRAPRS